MLIASSREVQDIWQLQQASVRRVARARQIRVPLEIGKETPDADIEAATLRIAHESKVDAMAWSFRYSPEDPIQLREAADHLESLAGRLNKQAKALEPKQPPASISFVKTGTGATIGAIGGYSVGLLLQELGKAGKRVRDPFVSTFALACTIGGVAVVQELAQASCPEKSAVLGPS